MVAPAGYGGPVPRRLSDPAVLAEQLAHLDDEHVAPLNALAARLREQHAPRPVPSVAPLGAGTGARVLALLRAPGPSSDPATGGTGLLSIEDDDPGAERLHALVTGAGIDPALVLPWGAAPYPVPGEEPLSTPDVKAGRAALEGLVPLLPRLRSVVLHGKDAEAVWSAYAGANRSALLGVRVEPWTFGTDDEALSKHRASRLRRLAATYASVADALR